MLATAAPSQFPPPSIHAFPPVSEPPQPAQTDLITATLDALAEAIATLKTGLETILSAQQSAESCAPEPEAARSRAERCKFCRSATHLEEECEEADKYILTGKCKRNVFGKIVLPSGAEVPRRIKGKCLRKRFEEYHRQYPGQQAAPAYLEDLARPQRPAPQDAMEAMPPVMGAMSLDTKATTPAMCEALRQPHSPECTLCDPRAASDQKRTPEVSSDPRKTKWRPSATLAVPRIIARPSSGQSGPERYEAATGAPLRMCKSNFAQQLSTAARFLVSSEACAMYSVQATTPQLTRDPEREEAMPFKRPQVLATAVVARASAAPLETVQKAADPASVVPLSIHEVPASVHNTASPPRSVHDSCSVPSHVSSSVPKSPSVRFSVPENHQLASQSPHTPNAIRSWPRWP